MISKRDLIKTIFIAGGNLEHIAKTKNINGTLLMEIERVMEQYKNEALNLTAVSQQSELLAFVKEVSEFDALVSSTRLRVKAKELLKANYG